jgi:L-malate glycosyltransferase
VAADRELARGRPAPARRSYGTRALLVNHTSTISGGEHSLLELLRAVPADVKAVLACPEGPLADAARALDIRVESLPRTDGSLKLHPWHTARGLVSLARAGVRIWRTAARHRSEIVHANSIRAGLSAGLARRLGGPPVVVHVRDCLPGGRVSAAVSAYLRHNADAIVCNSSYTLDHFGRPERGVVVHNPVDPVRFDPRAISRREARWALGLDEADVVLGVVAQLTPWKGQDDAVRAAALLRDRGVDVKLVLAGSAKFTATATRHDNISYVDGLHALVASLGMQDRVRFLGETSDVPAVLAALDLLLLPSWEEPFGRAVIEAFAMAVPVVATDVGGTCEVVTDGYDGLLRPPREPRAWAEGIVSLLERPEVLGAMRQRGRQKALDRFTPERHAAAVAAIYEDVCSSNGASRSIGWCSSDDWPVGARLHDAEMIYEPQRERPYGEGAV